MVGAKSIMSTNLKILGMSGSMKTAQKSNQSKSFPFLRQVYSPEKLEETLLSESLQCHNSESGSQL